MSKTNNKMTKDIVPEGFTMSLALVDAVPVLFFGINFIMLGLKFNSILFSFGALLCLFAGAAKVLWKIIVVLRQKNIWWLFLQMRILMPVGFLLMIISLIAASSRINVDSIISGLTSMPSFIFFLLGILGMCLMILFAVKLDSSDVKSNWIEQLTNGISQICFFIGIILL